MNRIGLITINSYTKDLTQCEVFFITWIKYEYSQTPPQHHANRSGNCPEPNQVQAR